jgi:hypothetical protein
MAAEEVRQHNEATEQTKDYNFSVAKETKIINTVEK